MCLITEQKRAKILKEDLVVYKMLRVSGDNIFAWMQAFQYEFGFLHKTKMAVDNIAQSAMDDDVVNAYDLDSFLDNSTHLTHVHLGFHFATSIKRFSGYDESIFKCIVPKGSRVYFDKTGLGVSNQIKIIKHV